VAALFQIGRVQHIISIGAGRLRNLLLDDEQSSEYEYDADLSAHRRGGAYLWLCKV
jgi:hypothetical protein